jgi:diphosphomevalonate decarboxylase
VFGGFVTLEAGARHAEPLDVGDATQRLQMFEKVGDAMEHSALLMHASMLGARPALIYMNAATLAVITRVRELRRNGTFAYFTMDAGPHVKVLTQITESSELACELELVPGVSRVIVTGVGGDARIVGDS